MSGEDSEFDHIRKRLAPLSADAAGAFNLSDDAALMKPRSGYEVVLTSDMLIAGVHFLDKDPAADIAAKALAVSLSDLAAMGADARYYMTSISWPAGVKAAQQDAFSEGLKAAQAEWGVTLIGGDTTVTPGPWTISVTAIGEAPQGASLTRAGAKPGEAVWVSGEIGGAGLGLAMAKGGKKKASALLKRYRRPEPRLALGRALRGLASSVIDVSDGLIADLGHIARVSGVGVRVEAESVPVPAEIRKEAAEVGAEALIAPLTSGDDYELAFTAPKTLSGRIQAIAERLGLPLTQIGETTDEEGVRLVEASGVELPIESPGFTHF
jgi:thiamine-monophosphate kinase